MKTRRDQIINLSAPPSIPCRPSIQLEWSLPSEVAAISPFLDQFTLMLTECSCVPGCEGDVEIALREAVDNAVIHGNHEDSRRKVSVECRCVPGEVSITVRDEGHGFDINVLPDPTVPENIGSTHGRGIYLMRAFMDEVRFEDGGALVRMRKRVLRPEPPSLRSGTF